MCRIKHYRTRIWWLTFLALTAVGLGAGPQPARSQEGPSLPAGRVPEGIPAEEQPFWDSAQVFADAYARKDAAAIGELFTEDAEFTNEAGERLEGRAAIVERFAEIFAARPDTVVDEIALDRIHRVNDSVALEEGRVATTPNPGGIPEISRYLAVHVKGADGKWRIASLRDDPSPDHSPTAQLQQLDWLLGEWVSEDPSAVVHTESRRSEDGNFILRRFTVEIAEENVMSGVQRIGWDPIRKEIRSWVFDSEGGYVEGTWRRSGNQWLVTSSGYTADGETASGLAVYTLLSPERITWHYRNLIVGDEWRENGEPIMMVRRPPAPQTGE